MITPYVEYSVNYDDNLLRLRDRSDALALFNDDQLSDMSTRKSGGLRLDKMWGLQRFTADVSLDRTQFDHFRQFDYAGKNGQAKWNWALGTHLQGSFGTLYNQTLTPFQDFRVFERNVRSQLTNSADIAWRIHPDWRARALYSRFNLRYTLNSQLPNNQQVDTTELGLDYLARSGSSVGIQLRHLTGTFPHSQFIGFQEFSNNYTQEEMKARIDWLVTGKSRLQFLGGAVQRKHEFFATRDFTGFNARLTANWQATGKLGVTGVLWRELGAVDDLTANFAMTQGQSLSALLDMSAKVRLDGTTTYQRRNYNGAQVIPGLTSSDRKDRYQRTSVNLTYAPTAALSLVTSLYREVQDSNIQQFSYRANGVSLTTRYEF